MSPYSRSWGQSNMPPLDLSLLMYFQHFLSSTFPLPCCLCLPPCFVLLMIFSCRTSPTGKLLNLLNTSDLNYIDAINCQRSFLEDIFLTRVIMTAMTSRIETVMQTGKMKGLPDWSPSEFNSSPWGKYFHIYFSLLWIFSPAFSRTDLLLEFLTLRSSVRAVMWHLLRLSLAFGQLWLVTSTDEKKLD